MQKHLTFWLYSQRKVEPKLSLRSPLNADMIPLWILVQNTIITTEHFDLFEPV